MTLELAPELVNLALFHVCGEGLINSQFLENGCTVDVTEFSGKFYPVLMVNIMCRFLSG